MANETTYYFDMLNSRINDVRNKCANRNWQIRAMLNRTNMMFEYDGLPDSIPKKMLELQLQTNGNVLVADVGGSLYSFIGGLGGERDAYYRPTKYTVANPYLKLSKIYDIGENGVIIYNDTTNSGLLPIFTKYADLLAENELTMSTVDLISRIQVLISAQDDRTKESANKYITDLIDGKLGVIGESAFLDSLKALNLSTNNHGMLTELIEYEQYLKASQFIELGLNSNFNMKRESIMAGEASLNSDSLFPLVENMLYERREGFDRVNDMFGTSITVDFASSWKDNVKELEAELENLEEGGEQTDDTELPEEDDSTGVSGGSDGKRDI